MDYDQLANDVEAMRDYINGALQSILTACDEKADTQHMNDTLYQLADAAKDITCMAGFYMRNESK